MRLNFLKICFVLLSVFGVSLSYAETMTVSDGTLVFLVDTDKGYATVTGLRQASPSLIIPDEVSTSVGTYPVTRIGKGAFVMNQVLNTVTFGKNVNRVEMRAFALCSNLGKVVMNESVERIDESAFYECTKLADFALPKNLKYIFDGAFDGCNALKEVTIPASVTMITINPWRNCASLKKFSVEEGSKRYTAPGGVLVSGGDGIISYPCGLESESYDIPEGITTLTVSAFHGASKLKSVTIPASMEIIGEKAFAATGLTKFHLPATVKTLKWGILSECQNLREITVDPASKNFSVVDGYLLGYGGLDLFASVRQDDTVNIPAGVVSIGPWVFKNMTSFFTVNIPSSVTAIGDEAFFSTYVMNVNFSNGLVGIGPGAFALCSLLQDVTFPASLKEIKKEAFYRCSNMEKVVLPKGLTLVEFSAFREMDALKEVEILCPDAVFGTDVFSACGFLEKAILPEGMKVCPEAMFYMCTHLISCPIPSTVTEIQDYFLSDTNILSVNLPSGLKKIGVAAFQSISRLKQDIVLPDNVEEVGMYAFGGTGITGFKSSPKLKILPECVFNNCPSLANCELNDGLEKISRKALSACRSLTELRIPASVKEIGDQAISYDTSLKNLFCGSTVPPTVSGELFDVSKWDGYSNVALNIPVGCNETYKTAAVWKKFKNIKESLSDVESVAVAEPEIVKIFGIDGKQRVCLGSGVNICIMSDGSRRKIIK